MSCRFATRLLLVMFLGVAAADAGAQPSRPPTRQDYRERYGVVSDRNIFVKDRSRPAGATSRPSRGDFRESRPYTPPPEAAFLLTGIVIEEGQLRAYVEDGPRSKIVRLAPGDAVARGRVEAIEIDAILYDHDGQQTWVEIGQNLTGAGFPPVAIATGDPTTAGATTAPTAGTTATTPLDPNSPTLSMEEKMRLRRAAELKK
jgi:hypothetical protein